MKEIKLNEKPFMKHCNTKYKRIIKKKISNKLILLIICSKKFIIISNY